MPSYCSMSFDTVAHDGCLSGDDEEVDGANRSPPVDHSRYSAKSMPSGQMQRKQGLLIGNVLGEGDGTKFEIKNYDLAELVFLELPSQQTRLRDNFLELVLYACTTASSQCCGIVPDEPWQLLRNTWCEMAKSPKEGENAGHTIYNNEGKKERGSSQMESLAKEDKAAMQKMKQSKKRIPDDEYNGFQKISIGNVVPVSYNMVNQGLIKEFSLLLSAVQKGDEIRYHIVKSRLELDVIGGTALLDMYAKCGSVEVARHLFDKLSIRDRVLWNAMIVGYHGYAQNGYANEALTLFRQMQLEDVKQELVTMSNIKRLQFKENGQLGSITAKKRMANLEVSLLRFNLIWLKPSLLNFKEQHLEEKQAPKKDKEDESEDEEEFLDDKRIHISDGIIIGQDDYEGKSLVMNNEAISTL
eukprot:Gb_31143 [translate_table: standard]